jgi:hypothetical protein
MVDFFRIFRPRKGEADDTARTSGNAPPLGPATKLEPPRIFISYATADGAAFASRLRRDLEAEGHSIWGRTSPRSKAGAAGGPRSRRR